MQRKNVLRREPSKKPLIITAIIIFLFLSGFVFYFSYIMYGYTYVNDIPVNEQWQIENIINVINNLFKPTYLLNNVFADVLDYQKYFWGGYAGAVVLSILILLPRNKNEYKGMEYGSAKFISDYDLKLIKKETNGIPVAKDIYVPLNDNSVVANLNEIVIGGSGVGKSLRKIKPDIMQLNGSYVITDPSGELYRDLAKMLMANHYDVKVLNLIDVSLSNTYNPFYYIQTEQDVLSLCSLFMKNSAEEGEKNDFWSGAALDLMTALAMYLFKTPNEIKSFGRIARLVATIRYKGGQIDQSCELARLLNEHAIKYPYDTTTINWSSMQGLARETMSSITKVLSTRLRLWAVPDVDSFTLEDEMDFDNLGVKKTAIFLIIPAARQTYRVVAKIFYSQLFERLMRLAEQKYNGKLPLLVNCELDEFANIGEIPSFAETLSVVRKYNIRICIVLQGLSQLKSTYEKTYDGIIGNCDIFTFLGSKDLETLDYISKKLGEITVQTDSRSYNRGEHGGGSDSESKAARPLLKPDEVRRAMRPKGKNKKYGGCCIIWIGALDPIYAPKYDTLSHPLINMCGSSFEKDFANNTDIKSVYEPIREERIAKYNGKMAELHKAEEAKEALFKKKSKQSEKAQQAEYARQWAAMKNDVEDVPMPPDSEN